VQNTAQFALFVRGAVAGVEINKCKESRTGSNVLDLVDKRSKALGVQPGHSLQDLERNLQGVGQRSASRSCPGHGHLTGSCWSA
jgi:hypothetical protein